MRTLALCLAVSSLAFAPVAAMAESPWTVKVGFSQVNPKSDNGSLAGGAFEAEVSSEVGFTPSIEYKFAPNIVGEVLLAIPFEHEVKDTKSDTKIASFKHLPPTFSAKYLFTPDAAFSPYVGLGLNYTLVYDEKIVLAGAKLKGKDSIGLAANVGFEYRMPNSPWGISADLRYIKIESDLTLNGNDIGTLTVDPVVLGVSAAYHF
ncbi:MAG: outer membrane beta-barrel protein [Moraxellaceae bacterium]|nr:outer membrane beta-barrel protein [Pseudomonadales bacterium]MCP5173515.1 outer membrane beta-barrel protein [Moraxellaceae bacterium]MCP5178205.1 outer membrane beta-barrel protein [Moraxellaceae bacterium]HQV21916.1 OmpW family outer membrane protein [Agitococcus sp.]